MSVLEYLAKIDLTAVQFEKAKRDIENAKINFEKAKQAYEEVLTQAESLGLSKAKLKRVAEERVNALLDSGLLDIGKEFSTLTKKTNDTKDKSPKGKKKSRHQEDEENQSDFEENGFEARAQDESDDETDSELTEATM